MRLPNDMDGIVNYTGLNSGGADAITHAYTDFYGFDMNSTSDVNGSIETFSRGLQIQPPSGKRNWSCEFRDPSWRLRVAFDIGMSLPVEIMGILGNLLALVVLFKLKPTTTTTVLLQCLAVADIFVLLFSIMFRSARTLTECYLPNSSYWRHFPYLHAYLYPFVYIARMCSTWLTVLLTVDRYIAVCKPLHAQRLCTLSRVWKEVVALVIVALLYTIPRFFEFSTKTFRPTEMNKNKVYTLVYKICLFAIVTYIIPILMLSILNILLVRNLRRADACRDQLRAPSKEGSAVKRDITLVVAVVVMVFLFCNIPAMASHIVWSVEITFQARKGALVDARRHMSRVSNFLVVLNSAINFVIYCLCSRNFRKGVRRICFRQLHPHLRRVSQNSSGKSASTYFSLNSAKQPPQNGELDPCMKNEGRYM